MKMTRIFSGAACLAMALWFAYAAPVGGLLNFALHAESDGESCAQMQVHMIEMQGETPRDFTAEKTLQARMNRMCSAASKEAKAAEALLPGE